MAGSYSHLQHGIGTIENMGDAVECIEELYYLVRAHLDDKDIEDALKAFYRFKRGTEDPTALSPSSPEFESEPARSDYGKAYLETVDMMKD